MGNRARGAVSIEFALVFGLFIALLYAIASYALAFLLVQGFTAAAADGLRAGIAVDCTGLAAADCVDDAIKPAVRQQVVDSLAWLPAATRSTVLGANGEHVEVSCDGETCEAVVRYEDYRDNGLTPVIQLPLIGAVPRLPQDLIGRGRLRI